MLKLLAAALLLPILTTAASSLTTAASSLTTNTTTAKSGDTIQVSWAHLFTPVQLQRITPLSTVWSTPHFHPNGSHDEPVCSILGNGTGSYWVGQFSPAITSLDQVTMTGDPAHGQGANVTEGTPPFTTPAPIKFISGTQLAKGFFNFKVTNMRTDINWVLFEGSLNESTNFYPRALSSPVQFTDQPLPQHGRLSRTSSTDEIQLSWTQTTCVGCSVEWGVSQAQLDRQTTQPPTTTTYQASDLCGVPANNSGWFDPGVFYTVILDLSQDAVDKRRKGLTYFYRYGSNVSGWSAIRSFLAPKPAHPHVSMNILVTADMGETYEDGSQYHWEEPSATNTTVQMKTLGEHGRAIDIVMHPGDLAYSTGYGSEWDRFMEQIEPLSTAAPYMTGQGNHERDFPLSGNSIGRGDSGGECGIPTQTRFPNPVCPEPNTSPCIRDGRIDNQEDHKDHATFIPSPTFNAGKNRMGPVGPQNDGWYSFNQGNVHFLMLNTEMSSANGSRQHQFVANDLSSVDRAVTPWVFVFGHRQMYSNNVTTPQNNMGDLEPLLLTYKVDIAFWGHIHFAQQSCPMYKAKCVLTKDAAGYDAPIHTVIGNAGQSLTPINYSPVSWSRYNVDKFGFSQVDVTNATHLTMNFFHDVPLGEAPVIDHSFDLVRAYPRS